MDYTGRVSKLLLVFLLVTASLFLACGGAPVPVVRMVLSSGQCMPATITLRRDETVRISFLNQDSGGARWQLLLYVPTKERPNVPETEPTLELTAPAQQSVSGQITPRHAGQFEYTCVTQSRSVIVSAGKVRVVE